MYNLKVMIAYANFLGPDISFYDIQKKEQIIEFLDTKIKNAEIDPYKKWITTWNHNLHRVKYYFRWHLLFLQHESLILKRYEMQPSSNNDRF